MRERIFDREGRGEGKTGIDPAWNTPSHAGIHSFGSFRGVVMADQSHRRNFCVSGGRVMHDLRCQSAVEVDMESNQVQWYPLTGRRTESW